MQVCSVWLLLICIAIELKIPSSGLVPTVLDAKCAEKAFLTKGARYFKCDMRTAGGKSKKNRGDKLGQRYGRICGLPASCLVLDSPSRKLEL